MKEKWFNNKMLMIQLIILPPVFLYGLYYSKVFKPLHKNIFYVGYLIATMLFFVIIVLKYL